MKLHSKYLNPFQPFPERELGGQSTEECRDAIEDNLSRSLFSAIGNATPDVFAKFFEAITPNDSSTISSRVKSLAEILRNTDSDEIELDLQSWPSEAMRDSEKLQTILIGISSSHGGCWTHDKRYAPESPRPDAWIYVRGKMLIVFECKNDECALDATQISAYAHELKLLAEQDNVPRARPNSHLNSNEEAQAVQRACTDLVLDVPWSKVVSALEDIQKENRDEKLVRWLCGKAAEYIKWHVLPTYHGISTILEWLNGPDTAERRNHLRRLVKKMGQSLVSSINHDSDAISFEQDDAENFDLAPGSGSAVFVKLRQNGKSLQCNWRGRIAPIVLWFQFAEDERERIGIESYIQATGSHANGKRTPEAWNEASDRHFACAIPFEKMLDAWCREAPITSKMSVETVRFNGKSQKWFGGGITDLQGLKKIRCTPTEALQFLRIHREKLWRFPTIGQGGDAATIAKAASEVRKPAISLLADLDVGALAKIGEDNRALQNVLKKAVASIVTST